MSRRSRKKRGEASSGGWLGKAAIASIFIVLVGSAVMYSLVRSYLHSNDFRRFLSEKAGKIAGVNGDFSPFRWDGLAVDSSVFDGSGLGPIKNVRIDELHTEVGIGGLRRGVWEIQGSRIQRLDLSLDARKSATRPTPQKSDRSRANSKNMPNWLPSKIELQGMDINEVHVKAFIDQGLITAANVRVRVEPVEKNNNYRVELADGTVQLPFSLLSNVRLRHAKLRYQDRQVFLSKLTASVWKDGRLQASGEWDRTTGNFSAEGDVSEVKCENVFNEDWAKRFVGEMSSDYSVDNRTGSLVARGHLKIHNGTLTALPLLDSLAAYADTRRFRVLALNDAHTDWHWKNGEIILTDLVLASEGLIRLQGSMIIRGKELDGSFRLGLATGTLASIPGAETDVFSAGERGLMWAPLRITGTLDDPKEDLTDRLIAAAGLRMFDVIPETGEKVIKYTQAILRESPQKVIEKGSEILEKRADIVEDVVGVLDGFLGGSRPIIPKKEPELPPAQTEKP